MKAAIEKWYADKIGKTPEEFNAIDKHIETVIQTWENEREKILSLLSNKESEEEKGNYCSCSQAKGLDVDEFGDLFCIECQKNVLTPSKY